MRGQVIPVWLSVCDLMDIRDGCEVIFRVMGWPLNEIRGQPSEND